MAKSKTAVGPVGEPAKTVEETPPETKESVTGSSTTEAPPAPLAEPLPAAARSLGKGPKTGLYDDVVVIDKEEFTAMIRNLTHGYTHDYYGLGLVSKVQRMFHVKAWEDARALFSTFMKG